MTINCTLSISPLEETIEIAVGTALVEVFKSEISCVVERNKIDDIHKSDRVFSISGIVTAGIHEEEADMPSEFSGNDRTYETGEMRTGGKLIAITKKTERNGSLFYRVSC